jgi:hypothetical protein
MVGGQLFVSDSLAGYSSCYEKPGRVFITKGCMLCDRLTSHAYFNDYCLLGATSSSSWRRNENKLLQNRTATALSTAGRLALMPQRPELPERHSGGRIPAYERPTVKRPYYTSKTELKLR